MRQFKVERPLKKKSLTYIKNILINKWLVRHYEPDMNPIYFLQQQMETKKQHTTPATCQCSHTLRTACSPTVRRNENEELGEFLLFYFLKILLIEFGVLIKYTPEGRLDNSI